MPPIRRLILPLLLVFLSWVALYGDEPSDILEQLQKRYENLNDLEVNFKQEVNSGVFASKERDEGTMYLAKGDKFMINTDDQTICSNGKLLWVYSVENKQVTIDKIANATDLVRPSDYLFSFKESYDAKLLPDTTIGKVLCRVVQLVCREKDEFIQKMTLYVGSDDLLTHRAEYVDINGNIVTMEFSNIKVDEGLPAKMFEFKTPKGVEEIRLP